MIHLFSLTAAILIGTVLTYGCVTIAKRFGWVEHPRKDRWHRRPVARFGGMALWSSFVTASFAFLPADNTVFWKIIAPATFVSFVGLWDDIFGLGPRRKLLLQALAASFVLAAGVAYPFRESVGVNLLVSMVWIIGLMNAFNLIDNIDGLSAGTALIACAYLLILFSARGAVDVVSLLSVLFGVLLGFLMFNFHPAKIFMGDSGSLFIGFLLASVSMLDVTHLSGFSALLFVPVLVFLVPILDTFFVSVTRRLRGQPISQGGTDHTSHRLVRFGFGEREAVILLYMLSAASGAIALVVRSLPLHHGIALTALWVLVVCLFGVNLFRASPDQLMGGKGGGQGRLHPDSVSLILDPVALSLAAYGAFLVRFTPDASAAELSGFLISGPIIVLSQMAALIALGVYRDSWWRSARQSTYRILQGIIVGTAVCIVVLVGADRFEGHSRLLFAADAVLAFLLLVAIRQSAYFARDVASILPRLDKADRPVLILGTYQGAEAVLRLLGEWQVKCVGLVDLNHGSDTGRRVWGCPVLGGLGDLRSLVSRYSVQEVVLSERQVSDELMLRISEACQGLPITVSLIGRHPITLAPGEVPPSSDPSKGSLSFAAKAGATPPRS